MVRAMDSLLYMLAGFAGFTLGFEVHRQMVAEGFFSWNRALRAMGIALVIAFVLALLLN